MIAFFSCVSVMNAQTSVTFIINKKIGNTDTKVLVNGNEAFSLKGNVLKTYTGTPYIMPMQILSPCCRQANINLEGKTMFSVNMTYTNPIKGTVSIFSSEIQLNLTSGVKRYVLITNKGLTDMQLKEITEAEAIKMMKNKKMVQLQPIDL